MSDNERHSRRAAAHNEGDGDESKPVRQFLTPEWGWRALMFLGLVANTLLTQNYVTRVEYKEDTKKLEETFKGVNKSLDKVNIGFADVHTSLAVLTRDISVLTDHEARIRSLEHHLP